MKVELFADNVVRRSASQIMWCDAPRRKNHNAERRTTLILSYAKELESQRRAVQLAEAGEPPSVVARILGQIKGPLCARRQPLSPRAGRGAGVRGAEE
jgi:hypothetical protein